MNRLLTALVSIPLFAGDHPAVLRDHLQKSSAAFERAVDGLTDAQWNFKPAPDRWSIAECAEHIVLTEDALRGLIEKNVLTRPRPEGAVPDREKDAKVLEFITSREGKAKAPEMLQPKAAAAGRGATARRFRESREQSMRLAARADLRSFSMNNGRLGEMDAHQWVLYLSGHVLRHVAQMEEVKASPGYPK